MDVETVNYLLKEYHHLLPRQEALALKNALLSEKLAAFTDEQAREQRRASMVKAGWLSTDEEVLALMRDGIAALRAKLAEKIYAAHGGEALWNNCPKCQRLARTSLARQCRYCGHDWH